MATLNEMRRAQSLGVAYANIKRKTKYVPSESLVAGYRPTRYSQESGSLETAQIGAGETPPTLGGGGGLGGLQNIGLGRIPALINELRQKSPYGTTSGKDEPLIDLPEIPPPPPVNIMDMPVPQKRRIPPKRVGGEPLEPIVEPLEPTGQGRRKRPPPPKRLPPPIPTGEEPPPFLSEQSLLNKVLNAPTPEETSFYPYGSTETETGTSQRTPMSPRSGESMSMPSEYEPKPLGSLKEEKQEEIEDIGPEEMRAITDINYVMTGINDVLKSKDTKTGYGFPLINTIDKNALEAGQEAIKSKKTSGFSPESLWELRNLTRPAYGPQPPYGFKDSEEEDVKFITEATNDENRDAVLFKYYEEVLSKLQLHAKSRFYKDHPDFLTHNIKYASKKLQSVVERLAEKHEIKPDIVKRSKDYLTYE